MERRENREDIIGRQVGRYHVVSHLATGGMSELYIARQEAVGGFEKNIVLKLLQHRYAQHTRVVGMFLDEARLAAKLNHPNIVHVYDVAEEAGNKFIAMEYIHGETLTDVIKRSVEVGTFLPIEHAVHIISQVAAGLDYAHRRHDASGGLLRIVHRDVSPSNIMVSYEGQTKIIDFGIARVQDQIREESGMHPGKASYMSPEQINGAAVDYRSDIFSLGIILYETTTARRLWRGQPEDVMRRILSEAIAPPTTIRADYPAALEAIVMKALERRPENRYQAAEEMRHDLEEFIAAVGYRTGSRRVAMLLRELFPIKAALSDEGIIQPRLAGDSDSAPLPLVGADPQPGSAGADGGAAIVPTLLPATAPPSMSPLGAPPPAYPPGMMPARSSAVMGAVPELIVPRGPSNAKLAAAAAVITLAAVTIGILLARSRHPDEAVADVAADQAGGAPRANQPAAAAPASAPVAAAAPSPEPPTGADPAADPTLIKVTTRPDSSAHSTALSRSALAASERARNRRQRRQVGSAEVPNRAGSSGSSSPTTSAPASPPSSAPPPPQPSPEPSRPPPAAESPGPAPIPSAPAARISERYTPTPPPAPPGFVDPKGVSGVVRVHAAEVQGCFDRALMERTDLHGRLTVRASIDAGGRVLSVTPTAVMNGGGRLQACVVGVFQKWTFPPPAGGVKGTFSYSFAFE